MARKPSVARVVAATLVTVTTLLLSAFGAAEYVSTRRMEIERLHGGVVSQAHELALGLALPVWNIDRPQIDKILDSQAGTPPVHGVVVTAAGQVHARVRRGDRFVPSDGHIDAAGLVVAGAPIVFNGDRIGIVRLYATTRYIEERLRHSLLIMVAAIVGIDILLTLFVYLVLWRAVLRPLVEVERYAGAVSAGVKGATLPARPEPTAELESLRVSIETMVRLLDQRFTSMQQSEQRFRTIFDSVHDGIFVVDVDSGMIVDLNTRACEMYGWTRERVLNQSLAGLSYAPEAVRARLQELGDGRQMVEWHSRHQDGHFFWTEVSTRMATLDGKTRAIVVVRDIEQRKELQEALRRSETMSAMGSLVAGVAHEVRNPLFGISALLDAYAEEMSASSDLAELSAALREQVTRLSQLMRELLEFGRPVTINRTPGTLPDLIDEVIHSRSRAADDARIELRRNVTSALPSVLMDRGRLRQVFENLVDNALQHAPAVKTVTIGAAELSQGGRNWVELRVEDDGRGFAAGDIAHVFEPFFTRRERGVGLGMSIVQRIVEEHSGRVAAANRSEGGAVVTVRLPAAPA
jgi:PAS domain S-box-containing protein